jgi:hypothetical protein
VRWCRLLELEQWFAARQNLANELLAAGVGVFEATFSKGGAYQLAVSSELPVGLVAT